MDQNQSSWQPLSRVLDQKLRGEEFTPLETQAPASTPLAPLSSPLNPTLTPAETPSISETPTSETVATTSTLTLSPQNLALLERLTAHLAETTASLTTLIAHLKGGISSPEISPISDSLSADIKSLSAEVGIAIPFSYPLSSVDHSAARVLEGVFDGTRMVGADGAFYPVPPNYSSKSKLVEGDLMKLTITPTGSFIYKQIGPIKRRRIIGELLKRQDGDTILYDVLAQNHVYHVLSAAITYFKGEAGDEAAILVPESSPSKWAAVEYIVKKSFPTNG